MLKIHSLALLTRVVTHGSLAVSFILATALSVWAAPLPAPPQLSASSYLLIDHVSGRVLAEKNIDLRIEPASLTKMMTAYLVIDEIVKNGADLDEPVVISDFAQSMPGSRMFVEEGTVNCAIR